MLLKMAKAAVGKKKISSLLLEATEPLVIHPDYVTASQRDILRSPATAFHVSLFMYTILHTSVVKAWMGTK